MKIEDFDSIKKLSSANKGYIVKVEDVLLIGGVFLSEKILYSHKEEEI